jgi:hypothetical protein
MAGRADDLPDFGDGSAAESLCRRVEYLWPE